MLPLRRQTLPQHRQISSPRNPHPPCRLSRNLFPRRNPFPRQLQSQPRKPYLHRNRLLPPLRNLPRHPNPRRNLHLNQHRPLNLRPRLPLCLSPLPKQRRPRLSNRKQCRSPSRKRPPRRLSSQRRKKLPRRPIRPLSRRPLQNRHRHRLNLHLSRQPNSPQQKLLQT